MQEAVSSNNLQEIKLATIIPTYNESNSLQQVLEYVLQHYGSLIVVNDGSTDATEDILKQYKQITLISHDRRRGKGIALQSGLTCAKESGFTHVVTISAHEVYWPEHSGILINEIKLHPTSIVIGTRATHGLHSGLVSKTEADSLKQRWAAFFFRYITGLHVKDVLCGFRSYPIDIALQIMHHRMKHEYEQQSLIQAAWQNREIREIYLQPSIELPDRQMKYLRRFSNRFRICWVYTKAVVTRFFIPLKVLQTPGQSFRQKIRALIHHELLLHASPEKAAESVAWGVFIGILPIHGIQVITLLALSVVIKINRPLALLGMSVSAPPLLPFLIYLTIECGKLLVPTEMTQISLGQYSDNAIIKYFLAFVGKNLIPYLVGSVALAFPSAFVTYFFSLPFFRHFIHLKQKGIERA